MPYEVNQEVLFIRCEAPRPVRILEVHEGEGGPFYRVQTVGSSFTFYSEEASLHPVAPEKPAHPLAPVLKIILNHNVLNLKISLGMRYIFRLEVTARGGGVFVYSGDTLESVLGQALEALKAEEPRPDASQAQLPMGEAA